jgi:hypothetical protein
MLRTRGFRNPSWLFAKVKTQQNQYSFLTGGLLELRRREKHTTENSQSKIWGGVKDMGRGQREATIVIRMWLKPREEPEVSLVSVRLRKVSVV